MTGDTHLCIAHTTKTKTMNNVLLHILLCFYLLAGFGIIEAV